MAQKQILRVTKLLIKIVNFQELLKNIFTIFLTVAPIVK